MVEYYEDTLEHQAKDFHRIIEENHRMKKENNKLRAAHLCNDFHKELKGNASPASPFKKEKAAKGQEETAVPASPLSKGKLSTRISEL